MSVDDAHDFTAVLRRLEAGGLRVSSALPLTGTVVGVAPPSAQDAIRQIEGVAASSRRARSTCRHRSPTCSRPWHDPVVASAPADPQRLSDLARLRRVRDRMDREYAQPLDVEALARDAHMSAGHLSRQFRLAYGESPYGYLMTRRIERAMALLRRGDLSVTEVCFEVGCSSLGTFSTRFTELVGVPPSAYRRQAGGARPRGCRRASRSR